MPLCQTSIIMSRVDFVIGVPLCLIQACLGATTDYGIALMAHQAAPHKALCNYAIIMREDHHTLCERPCVEALLWPWVVHHHMSWSPCVGANKAQPMCLACVKCLALRLFGMATPMPSCLTLSHLSPFPLIHFLSPTSSHGITPMTRHIYA